MKFEWCVLRLTLVSVIAHAADAPATPYSGTLTGDWGGLRTHWGDSGIALRFEATGFEQGLVAGDGNDDVKAEGRFDGFVDLNSGKLGLWEGGGFHAHLEYRGDNLPATRGGALWPVNTGAVVPLGSPNQLEATSLYFSQRIGASASVMLGKINAVDLLASDPFFGGWGIHRFLNLVFVAPPSGVMPPVLMGALVSYSTAPWRFTAMMYDPDDQTDNYSFSGLFSNGVNAQLSAAWGGVLANRSATLSMSAAYSTQDGADLAEMGLPPDLRTSRKSGAWNLSTQMGYLLLESATLKGKGLGIYGKAAIADGNPNVIQSSFVGGLAGYGMAGRPNDSFGVGYFYYDMSDTLQSAINPTVGFNDEQGLELWYSMALTPWLKISADIQAIDPATQANSTVIVGGLRLNVVF